MKRAQRKALACDGRCDPCEQRLRELAARADAEEQRLRDRLTLAEDATLDALRRAAAWEIQAQDLRDQLVQARAERDAAVADLRAERSLRRGIVP